MPEHCMSNLLKSPSSPNALGFILKRFDFDSKFKKNSKIEHDLPFREQMSLEGDPMPFEALSTHHGPSLSSGHFSADILVEYPNKEHRWDLV